MYVCYRYETDACYYESMYICLLIKQYKFTGTYISCGSRGFGVWDVHDIGEIECYPFFLTWKYWESNVKIILATVVEKKFSQDAWGLQFFALQGLQVLLVSERNSCNIFLIGEYLELWKNNSSTMGPHYIQKYALRGIRQFPKDLLILKIL